MILAESPVSILATSHSRGSNNH